MVSMAYSGIFVFFMGASPQTLRLATLDLLSFSTAMETTKESDWCWEEFMDPTRDGATKPMRDLDWPIQQPTILLLTPTVNGL